MERLDEDAQFSGLERGEIVQQTPKAKASQPVTGRREQSYKEAVMYVTKSDARRNERGVSLAVVALVIVMVLSMSAIAIDYGMIKTAKAEAQRAMDASALAGASAFKEPTPSYNYDSAGKARAKEIAVQHTVHRAVVDTSSAHLDVTVDLVKKNVKATYTVPPISLWFAKTFGVNSMGLNASATAHAENTNLATCVKPVALPDAWDNGVTPSEDLNADKVWNFKDKNGGTANVWDEGETEPWAFNGADSYDSITTGLGTNFRDNLGTGVNRRTKDYGRQIFIMSFSPKDAAISSFYYSWGNTTTDNSATAIHDRILGGCEPGEVQHAYPAANGAKVNQVSDAWDELINQDPNATWVDDGNGSGTVTGSSKGANWLDQSPRVILVGLYNPSVYGGCSSCNTLQFNNIARVFLDKRPCGNGNGACKEPLTGHFLGLAGGGGPGGNPSGSLVKRIVLIK
jgi:Flp pilus assembly protein TadG